jgi:hypothetical protein
MVGPPLPLGICTCHTCNCEARYCEQCGTCDCHRDGCRICDPRLRATYRPTTPDPWEGA